MVHYIKYAHTIDHSTSYLHDRAPEILQKDIAITLCGREMLHIEYSGKCILYI